METGSTRESIAASYNDSLPSSRAHFRHCEGGAFLFYAGRGNP